MTIYMLGNVEIVRFHTHFIIGTHIFYSLCDDNFRIWFAWAISTFRFSLWIITEDCQWQWNSFNPRKHALREKFSGTKITVFLDINRNLVELNKFSLIQQIIWLTQQIFFVKSIKYSIYQNLWLKRTKNLFASTNKNLVEPKKNWFIQPNRFLNGFRPRTHETIDTFWPWITRPIFRLFL